MKPEIPQPNRQNDLFRSRLDQILNRKYSLFVSNKSTLTVVATYILFLIVFGCAYTDNSETAPGTERVRAFIIGSAEHPDPVLEMVQKLEKKGILQNVIVRESFPVQIEVTGPKSAIEKLQKIPRKVSPHFK